jgi:thiol-disulfide isomerase/thioredoxin
MEKNKIYVIILILVLISIFSGCTSSNPEENGNLNNKLPTINSIITGFIKDDEGNILENVNVTITNSKYDWQAENLTSISGYYKFDVFTGYFVIKASHEDYQEKKVGYNILENQTLWVNISLKPVGDEFSFTLLNGKTDKLSNYRGKVVLIDMWATWCTPCQLVMPQLKETYDHYSRDEVEIISIDIDEAETSKMILDFIDEFKNIGIDLNWIFGMEIDDSISEKYLKEVRIPTLIIFDQKGRLHFIKTGPVAFKEIPYYFSEDTPLLKPIIDELLE